MTAVFEGARYELAVGRRLRWAFPAMLAVLAAAGFAFREGSPTTMALVAVGVVGAFGAMIHRYRTRVRRGAGVAVEDAALLLGDEALPRSAIDLVYLGSHGVEVVAHRGFVRASIAVKASKREALRRSLAPAGARIVARVGVDPAWWFTHVGFIALLALPTMFLAPWLPLFVFLAAVWLRRDANEYSIEASGDGLTLRGWTTEFRPWREVTGIAERGAGLRVDFRDGRSMTFGDAGDRLARRDARVPLGTFLERANALRAEASGAEQLERAARVTAALAAGAPFREASVPREDLWRVVEGGAASPEVRAKAARQLTADATPEERGRLRIAAAWCGEPRVRVALEEETADSEGEEPGARREPQDV